jgi:hypothetical protein
MVTLLGATLREAWPSRALKRVGLDTGLNSLTTDMLTPLDQTLDGLKDLTRSEM